MLEDKKEEEKDENEVNLPLLSSIIQAREFPE